MDHYLQHQNALQEQIEDAMHTRDIVSEKWKSLTSELLADAILELIKQIYEFSLKSDEIEKTAKIIQCHLQELIDENK
jgi:hypothetical protein